MIGSINLASETIIPENGWLTPENGLVSIQLFSSDVSTTVTIQVQGSLDGLTYAVLKENGDNCEITLAVNTAVMESFEVESQMYLRFVVTTVATGTISYVIRA